MPNPFHTYLHTSGDRTSHTERPPFYIPYVEQEAQAVYPIDPTSFPVQMVHVGMRTRSGHM